MPDGKDAQGCESCDRSVQDISAVQLTQLPSPLPISEASIDGSYCGDLTAGAIQTLAATVPLSFEESSRIVELEEEQGQLHKVVAQLERELQRTKEDVDSQKHIKQLVDALQSKVSEQELSQSSNLCARGVELEQRLSQANARVDRDKAADTSMISQRAEAAERMSAEYSHQLSAARLQISALQQQVSDFTALCDQHSGQHNAQQGHIHDVAEQLLEATAAKRKLQQQCGEAQDKNVALEDQLTTVARERDEHASQHAIWKQRVSQLEQERACVDALKENYEKDRQAWKARSAEFQQKIAKGLESEQQLLTNQGTLASSITDLERQLCDAQRQNAQDKKQHSGLQPRIRELEGNVLTVAELSKTQSRENALLQERVADLEHELEDAIKAKLENETRLRLLAEQVPLIEEKLTDAACLQDKVSALEAEAVSLRKELVASEAHKAHICTMHDGQVAELEGQVKKLRFVCEGREQNERTLHAQIEDLQHKVQAGKAAAVVAENNQALQASLAELKHQSQQHLAAHENCRKEIAAAKIQNAQLEERVENLVKLNRLQAEANRSVNTQCADLRQTVEAERSKRDQLSNSSAVHDQQVQRLACQLSEALVARDELAQQSYADQLKLKELSRQLDDLMSHRDHNNLANRSAASRESDLEEQLEVAQTEMDVLHRQINVLNPMVNKSQATIDQLRAKVKTQDSLLLSLQQQTFAAEPAPTVGFKLVAKVGGRYFSLFAGRQMEYVLGSPVEDGAQPNHRSGIYFCSTPEEAIRVQVPASLSGNDGGGVSQAEKVVLKCACEGPFVEYSHGKFACSRLTPMEEVSAPSTRLSRCASAPNMRGTAVDDSKLASNKATHPLPAGNGRGVARFLRESEVSADGTIHNSRRPKAEGASMLA